MQLERHRRPHLTDGTGGVTRSYGILGNPYQTKTGSTVNAQYTYTSDGTRVKAVNGSGTGYVYRGSFVYSTTGSSEVLESVGFGGGRIEKNGTGYEVAYHITDHLGSVRSIVKNGTIVEQNDYYPYGGRHANSALAVQTSPAPNRWRFSGKEDLSAALGDPVLDFGARMYSSTGVKWQTQDPLAEKYYDISPYVYCASVPTLYIDPDGKKIWTFNKRGQLIDYNPDYTENDILQVATEGSNSYQVISNSIIKMASGTIDQYMLDEQGVVFSIKGESNAKNAFTSLANYTDVEWSYVSFNDMSFPQIGNSFEEHNNLTMLNSINGKEHLVKEAIHSHPNFPYPSGADKKTVSIIKSIFNNDTAVFSIYHVPSNLFIEYDENGAKYDEYLYEP